MRVFIIGGAGFLGTYLVPELFRRGHEVTVLTRSRDKLERIERSGAHGVVGDILNPESFSSEVSPCDLVIFIAMPSVKIGRLSRREFKHLRALTTTYFSNAIDITRKIKIPIILTSGTSFHSGAKKIFTESDPVQRFGMAKIGKQTDILIKQVLKAGNPPLIQMLPAQIYGNGGIFLGAMYKRMKEGKYRIIGTGENHIPRIHVKDLAKAYVQAVETMPLGERFIIADDGTCTVREFMNHMAECMRVKKPGTIPPFLVKMVMGRLIYETLMMNCIVSNEKAKHVLGWKPDFPTYREGLPEVIKEIEKRV